MNSTGAEKWRPMVISSSTTRCRITRSMPQWVMQERSKGNQKQVTTSIKPPPPPKTSTPPKLINGNNEPDYEVIDYPGPKPKCCLCGITRLSIRCDDCNGLFCDECDEANHKHPKRKLHIRRRLPSNMQNNQIKPPLPPKGEHILPPVPPPRKNRRTNQEKSTKNTSNGSMTVAERMAQFKRAQSIPASIRPLPSLPVNDTKINGNSQIHSNSNGANISHNGKISTLQERYRKYQEEMDAKRQRNPSVESSTIQREPSVPRGTNSRSNPTPLMPRILQSSSVCDLSAANFWNPNLQQAQSMAHLNGMNGPIIWYPAAGPWDSGSCAGLNQQPMWAYPAGYPPPQMAMRCQSVSRAQSPAMSVKSNRRYKAPPSPSPSLKSRRSLAALHIGRRRQDSHSDASSEDSGDSDFDDRLSRATRTPRRDSFSNPKSKSNNYRGDFPRFKRNWRSEDRINSLEDPWVSKHYGDTLPRRRYEMEDDRRSLKPDFINQSTDDDGSFSTHRKGRSKATSSSDDLPERRRDHATLSRSTRRLDRYGRESFNEIDEFQSNGDRSHGENIRSGKISSLEDSDGFGNSSGPIRETFSGRNMSKFSPIAEKRKIRKTGTKTVEKSTKKSPTSNKKRFLDRKKARSKTPDRHKINDKKTSETPTVEKTKSPTPINNLPVEQKIKTEEKWSCEHCTYLNKANQRICTVCCKTKSSILPETNNQNSNTSNEDIEETELSMKTEEIELTNGEDIKDDSSEIQSKMSTESNQSNDEKVVLENISENGRLNSTKSNDSIVKNGETVTEKSKINISNGVKSIDKQNLSKLKKSLTPDKIVRKLNSKSEKIIKGKTVSTGTSPPPQNISTQTYEATKFKERNDSLAFKRHSSVVSSKNSSRYGDTDSEVRLAKNSLRKKIFQERIQKFNRII